MNLLTPKLPAKIKVLEEKEHAKAEPAEPNAVYDGLSPEEFAAQLFGGGSLREPQEGFASLEWLKGQFETKSAAIRYLHSDQGGAHPPKVIAKQRSIRYQHAQRVHNARLLTSASRSQAVRGALVRPINYSARSSHLRCVGQHPLARRLFLGGR